MLESFTSQGIPIEDNGTGFAADNASVMMGCHNSEATRLKTLIPGIVVQGCICHSLHICASEACKLLPRVVEDVARESYSFLKSSDKRRNQLKEFQDFLDVDVHRLLHPSQTRWLSRREVVSRMLEQ